MILKLFFTRSFGLVSRPCERSGSKCCSNILFVVCAVSLPSHSDVAFWIVICKLSLLRSTFPVFLLALQDDPGLNVGGQIGARAIWGTVDICRFENVCNIFLTQR